MNSTMLLRALRGLGLGLALIAAVVVFWVGGQDGGADWRVPALVLIGVLVVILHVATSWVHRSVDVDQGRPLVVAHQDTNPHHQAEPGRAEGALAAGAIVPPVASPGHPGQSEVLVPPSAFPDAGHSHGPVLAVADGQAPPPLHAVLAPTSSPGAAPPPVLPPAPAAIPSAHHADSVLVDLTSAEEEEPLVYRVLPGPPPAAGVDREAPGVDPAPSAPSPPPFPPAAPSSDTGWAPPPGT